RAIPSGGQAPRHGVRGVSRPGAGGGADRARGDPGLGAARGAGTDLPGTLRKIGLSMSHPASPSPALRTAQPSDTATARATTVTWPDAQRHAAFDAWLAPLVPVHQLQRASLRPASADASFRRYLRMDTATPGVSCIVMDAPPDKEPCASFVQVQALL